jgi:hypothetical protein
VTCSERVGLWCAREDRGDRDEDDVEHGKGGEWGQPDGGDAGHDTDGASKEAFGPGPVGGGEEEPGRGGEIERRASKTEEGEGWGAVTEGVGDDKLAAHRETTRRTHPSPY